MDNEKGNMIEKIFIDSDIILDVLTERKKFFEPAAELFELGFSKKIELFTTAVVLANVFYMIRRTAGTENAKKNLQKLRLIVHILSVNEKVVDLSLHSTFGDFEDGLQYFTAKENNIPTIITRNIRHYKVKDLIVQTAEEYIKSKMKNNVGSP
jgi:predicted nucleic acid-binding protein